MSDLTTRILHALARPSYTPVKPKVLARRMGIPDEQYPEFRKTLRSLVRDARIEVGRDHTLRAVDPYGTVVGVYRRTGSGVGYVRPHTVSGETGPEVRVREGREQDAATGDEVMVRITRRATKTGGASGDIVRVLERATRMFVGTYFERDGQGHVRVDGTVFAHSVWVGDPGAKGARPQDKVVVDMLRFPTADERGEGVITEVLGPLGKPGVDTLSIIKGFGLPEAFPKAALEEARTQAELFREDDLDGREDFTQDTVITIDPADARDFDDAVSVTIDPKSKHWVLTVHIADVAHFCKAGGPLDAEARKRATSVYLPQKVIPMFPEVISNGLASLQQGKLRYVKTVRMEFTPSLQKGHVQFFNGAIRVRRRFTYEEVQAIFDDLQARGRPSPGLQPDVLALLKSMRDLALLLRKKRLKRGALELSMPEPVLEYDANGKVTGAHFAEHNLSHQVIEEFMLAANEAVAEHFSRLEVPFLRRVHPAPNEEKLEAFAGFAELLGYPMKRHQDRFELQRILHESADKPERAAIHYSLLRSLKKAAYSPIQDQHYALASADYCHFTSPIRRYPDLQVHRLFDKWVKTGKASADVSELVALGEHCTKMEKRAETAERELVKLKILQYLSTRLGEKLDAVITGVADYGFFAQAERFPAEGLVHISSLTDDYYEFDDEHLALFGRRRKKRYRLGDRVRVEVARVDVQRRMLDFRLATEEQPPREKKRPPKPGRDGKRRRG
ncbi:MAG TPA: ribonuclease R [Fimbriiglobus sp.]|nr:ribonuclease R [Fimbriiglobus sp.]